MKCYEPIRAQYDLLMAKTSPRNKQKWLGYKYGRIAGDIWIFPNEYMAYVIPEEEFYLDIEKVFDDKNPINPEPIYKESQQAEGAYFVELKHIREEGKGFKSVEVYKQTEGPGSVWIDANLTKGFNMLCCKYGMIDSKRPLFVYAEDTMALIGVVLPIAHKEDDNGEHQSDD